MQSCLDVWTKQNFDTDLWQEPETWKWVEGEFKPRPPHSHRKYAVGTCLQISKWFMSHRHMPSNLFHFRHHDPYLGSWRESFYQLPPPPHVKRQAPLPPLMIIKEGSKEKSKERKPRRKPEMEYMKASERAYKAFNQVWNCDESWQQLWHGSSYH